MSEGTQQMNTKDMQIPDNLVAVRYDRVGFLVFQKVPGIDNVAEVRRKGSVVGVTGCFRVGVRFWEVVRQLSWPGEHLSFLIRTVHYLNLNTSQNTPLKYGLKQ